jgi:hypothetical protein
VAGPFDMAGLGSEGTDVERSQFESPQLEIADWDLWLPTSAKTGQNHSTRTSLHSVPAQARLWGARELVSGGVPHLRKARRHGARWRTGFRPCPERLWILPHQVVVLFSKSCREVIFRLYCKGRKSGQRGRERAGNGRLKVHGRYRIRSLRHSPPWRAMRAGTSKRNRLLTVGSAVMRGLRHARSPSAFSSRKLKRRRRSNRTSCGLNPEMDLASPAREAIARARRLGGRFWDVWFWEV